MAPLSSLAGGTVTLVWNPTGGRDIIADYKVHYGAASGTYTNVVSAGANTSLTLSNLVQGSTYYFAATAVDTYGLESAYSDEASAFVPLNLPNQPPTLDPLVNLTFDENAGAQTVTLTGISSGATNENQTLSVTAASSNTGLIPTPTVNYTSPSTTGSITLAASLFGYGTAHITVTVNDGAGSNNLVSRGFTVTVRPVNMVPTLNPLPDLTINENDDIQTITLAGIGSGAPNEEQTLTITAATSDTNLITTPLVHYTSPDTTGTVTFTPYPDTFGSTVITVSVNDGGASNNIVTRSFTLTVNPVNQPPTLDTLADVTINENAGVQTIALSGIGSGAANEEQTLTVTAASSNPGLIPTPAVSYLSPNATGSISFTPVHNAYGSANLTVIVNDGGASNNITSRSFTVTVLQVSPRPPSCTYALTMSPTGVTANAASGTFSVSTTTTCAWTIATSPWVSLSSTNGVGPYAGTFTVDANTGLSRTGLVSILGGETDVSCVVTQQALAAGAAALAAPLDGSTFQSSPKQFSWTASDLAVTKYYLLVHRDGSQYLAQWVQGATNWTTPTDLPAGSYTWAVETWTADGAGPWSTNSSFTIQASAPGAIALVSPVGAGAANGTQRFTWKADPAASRYELYIEKDGSLFLDQWFAQSGSVVNLASGNFAVDLPGIGNGTYLWWVRGWSPAGYGTWSDRARVSLSPAP